MSNIIPPLLSNSPPPIIGPIEDDDDDDFCDFRTADLSYDHESSSLSPTPDGTPKKEFDLTIPHDSVDINSNSQKQKEILQKNVESFEKNGDISVEIIKQDCDLKFENITDDLSEINRKPNDECGQNFPDDCEITRNNETMQTTICVHKTIEEANTEIASKFSNVDVQKANSSEHDDKLDEFSSSANCFSNEIRVDDKNALQNVLNSDCDFDLKELNGGCNEIKEGTVNFQCKNYEEPTDFLKSTTSTIESDDFGDFVSLPVEDDEDFHDLSCSQNIIEESVITNDEFSAFSSPPANSEENTQTILLSVSSVKKSSSNEILQENEEISNSCDGFLEISPEINSTISVGELNSVDEYGQFFSSQKVLNNDETTDQECDQDNDDFGEFCKELPGNDPEFEDFSCAQINVISANPTDKSLTEDDSCVQKRSENTPTTNPAAVDEFEDDDFCDFTFSTANSIPETTKAACSSSTVDTTLENAREFGDFANFSDMESDDRPVTLVLDREGAFIKASSIVKAIFPVAEIVEDDFSHMDMQQKDVIFNELKDVTESNALLYQWSKSISQEVFLKALNIDTRNILYGPAWNPSMPRFAANLGLTPLEPIKSEVILTPTPVQQSSSPLSPTLSCPTESQPTNVVDIPNVEFDWSGSGLINPLEEDVASKEATDTCNKFEFEGQLNNFCPTASTIPSVLQPTSSALVNTGKTTVNMDLESKMTRPANLETIDSFNDFSSFSREEPTSNTGWANVVPLRETYISNVSSLEGSNVGGSSLNSINIDTGLDWLQPEILMPDSKPKKEESQETSFDDFDDFQMVLPEKEVSTVATNLCPGTASSVPSILQPNSLSNEKFLPQEVVVNSVVEDGFKLVTPNVQRTKPDTLFDFYYQTNVDVKNGDIVAEEKQVDNDDEFTDFYYSAPPPPATVVHVAPLAPVLEPLKPAIIHQTSVADLSMKQNQTINWPDPGITDDDIKHFELSYSRPPLNLVEVAQSPPKKDVKANVEDDDEWSDFVSVQQASPIHKISMNDRTASPDLPLSVLNLSNIQTPKKSIPVITPQGLMQTKLSSNMTVQHSTATQSVPFQPSMFSSKSFSKPPNAAANQLNRQQATAGASNQRALDDDDWTEFVSSPAVTSNGFTPSAAATGWKSSTHLNNWANNMSSSFLKSKRTNMVKTPKVAVQSKKSTIPSISSLPDLDFIAPNRVRTNNRK